ncbi:hypothetical protein LINPERPRIM_LOCUS40943 [Linum perenne]
MIEKGESSKGSRSWSTVVSDPAKDLKFIEIPESARVGGVLKLPSSVWEKGYERLKAALVAQFVGTPPPIRKGIKPLDLSKKSTPEWITIKNVPPAAISIEGISWLTSLLGKPWKNFVREGLDVKVCVLRDVAVPCPELIEMETENGDLWRMEVVRAIARDYKGTRKVWTQVHKEAKAVAGVDVPTHSPDPRVINDAVLVQVTPTVEAANKQVVADGSGKPTNSKTIKRRMERKKKKSAKKALSDSLEAVEDVLDIEGHISDEGENELNEIETEDVSPDVAEEGHDDANLETSEGLVEENVSSTHSNDGRVIQIGNESVEGNVRAWTVDDERDYKEGKTASKMQKSAERASHGRGIPQNFVQRVSGVKTRHKNKYR